MYSINNKGVELYISNEYEWRCTGGFKIGKLKTDVRNYFGKLSLGKARLECRLLLRSKKVQGCQKLADQAVQSLLVNVYNALGITLLLRNNNCMMMHACKQKCLQEQHKEQR